MKKCIFFTLFFAILSVGFLSPDTAEAHRRSRHKKISPIPTDLQKQIEDEFGPFKLASERDYCPNLKKHVKGLRPGMRWGYGDIADDFNGDGHVDYSVIVKLKEDDRYLWLMAIKKYTMGKPYLITNLGWPSIEHFYYTSKMMHGKLCEGVLVSGQAGTLTAGNPSPYLGLAAPPSGILLYHKDGDFYQTGYKPFYVTEIVNLDY